MSARETGGADYSCFEGFDCVLITGEGSLRFENTAGLECGGGMLPVPAVVVDGDVDVCCENFLAQPNEGCGLTVAVLNGTLRTDLLRWRNGDMLIAGGVMTARSISTFNPITVTCRGGVLLLDWPSDYEMTFVLSGGEAYLAGPLNEGTVVEAGAGILAAQDVSAAEIHGDGASVLGGEEAESWYFQTTYSEDWSGAQDGMTWDALTLADAGGAVGCALAAACWREQRLWRSGRHGTARRGRRRDFCREPQPLGLGRHPSSGVRTARRDGHDGRLWHGVQLRRGGHFRSPGRQLHLHGRDVDAERGNDRSGR